MNRLFVALVVTFGLVCTGAWASADYLVVKDKNGVCRVIRGKAPTPDTISGPYRTKIEALMAKKKLCGGGR